MTLHKSDPPAEVPRVMEPPPYPSTIQARTLIVQGDRDPFYPVEISVEMARAIPKSSLWIVPNPGHVPIAGERWPAVVKTASAFLVGQVGQVGQAVPPAWGDASR